MLAIDGASTNNGCLSDSIVLHISELGSDVFPHGSARLVMEHAYTLSIKPDRKCITITGSTSAGIFYGAVSLISLLQGTC